MRNVRKIALSSAALFCISLILASYSARSPEIASIGVRISQYALSPFQSATNSTEGAVSSWWDNYIDLTGVAERNKVLQEKLVAAEAELEQLREFAQENKALRALVEMSKELNLTGVGAEVIGLDPAGWNKIATINAGEQSGVSVGAPVFSGEGAVGQVIASGGANARVMLILDRASAVDVMLRERRTRGVLRGTGGAARLEYVRSEEQVEPGDVVVTSGMDGVFPKGIVVGKVSRVTPRADGGGLFHRIEIIPAVDFSQLEYVRVGKVIEREVPVRTPSPTPTKKVVTKGKE